MNTEQDIVALVLAGVLGLICLFVQSPKRKKDPYHNAEREINGFAKAYKRQQRKRLMSAAQSRKQRRR